MFEIGQKASVLKKITEKEVLNFSQLSMDKNPIHFDVDYASKSRFKQRIVQGPFIASLLGGILGSELPGPGTIYLNQTTNFLKPVFINDTVIANVEVISVRSDKPILKLHTWVHKESGELVLDGEATVMYLGQKNNK